MKTSLSNLPDYIDRHEVTKRVCAYVLQNFPEEKIDDFDLTNCVDTIMQGNEHVDEQSVEDSFVLIDEYFTISIQEIREIVKRVFVDTTKKRRKK